jgi:hypothetical protein
MGQILPREPLSPPLGRVNPNSNDPLAHKQAQQLAKATGNERRWVVGADLREKLARARRVKRSELSTQEMQAIAKQFGS